MEERARFLLDYIDQLVNERVGEASGFRHVAPGQPDAAPPPARGRERWVINKLRALNSWYTKGLDNGSHLRVAVNAADNIPQLREIIQAFFAEPALAAR
jgi:tRNA-dihydrouridine synthase